MRQRNETGRGRGQAGCGLATAVLAAAGLAACASAPSAINAPADGTAPGAPGAAPVWSDAAKTGIGTSYEAYVDGAYADGGPTGAVSRVWFSIANGVLTETMYGLIHEAQIRDARFIVTGEDFVDDDAEDMVSTIRYLDTDDAGRPLAPAYVIESRGAHGGYVLTKTILTDPDRQALVMRVRFTPGAAGQALHLLVNTHVANTGSGDHAEASPDALHAWEGATHLVVKADAPFAAAAAGFVGASDGDADLADGSMDWSYSSTGDAPGNVALTAKLAGAGEGVEEHTLVIGFGATREAAAVEADGALAAGFDDVVARYFGAGDHVGWRDYLASLDHLPELQVTATDGGALVNASALVLKTQEDKTHAGALIASLSNPWGETASAQNAATGYKAVWPRDFYQCAMAFLALGDAETAATAFRYLPQVQVRADTPGSSGATGWFMQKTHVDGEIEWVAVQLDQTAMPIMLGWKLWRAGVLSDAEIAQTYADVLKPAADFLVDGGRPHILWNTEFDVTPPVTQQDRWEEQWGYSPSTTAAVIAGLVTAADIAEAAGDAAGAARYRAAADRYESHVEDWMFTTSGAHDDGGAMNGRYFVRITRNADPNDHGWIGENNGRRGLAEDEILDAGFLELVRYGVRAPLAPSIVDTLPELDSQTLSEDLRVRYAFERPDGVYYGWRRYGNDGYGESETSGRNYGEGGRMNAGQRGRVWPFFTGERGHYALARALADGGFSSEEREALRRQYVRGLEHFANAGLMLPEQVWDGVGVNPKGYVVGEGTDSATPLAWTHAEYVKLLRSIADGAVWDGYDVVAARYGGE